MKWLKIMAWTIPILILVLGVAAFVAYIFMMASLPFQVDIMFEEKGYKLIDLNLGFEDLVIKTFEECIRLNNIRPSMVKVVSLPQLNIYMEYLTAVIHREYLTSIIEKETDLKLIPTYSYIRKYFQGSVLDYHTDRNPCEISLSYCISGPEWEIGMGDNIVKTKIGNGVIYKGCEISHGRAKPSSGEVIQVFSHWVISDGAKSNSAYDDGKNKEFYRKMPSKPKWQTAETFEISDKGIKL